MSALVFVGTSGWMYDWNPDGFRWYAQHSGLNAVELNASFYRFPWPSQVRAWARRGRHLRWAIKVHRSITHYHKLAGRAMQIWKRFRELFRPLEENIDFYLFQLPPSLRPTPAAVERVERFIQETGLGPRLAIEFRHPEWFEERWVRWIAKLGATWVSVDAPDLPRAAYMTSRAVYYRLHGRAAWYAHRYTEDELREIAMRALALKPERAFFFLNNDHDMLENARELLRILVDLGASPG